MLLGKIEVARHRVEKFFGSLQSVPTIIVGTDCNSLKKFGFPATNNSGITYTSFYGTYIVVTIDGLNEDIIAHELVHAELSKRIGYFNRFKIPLWFDEGLATQVDYRVDYSEKIWKDKTENGKNIPDLKSLENNVQFYDYDIEKRRVNYTIAKYEVKRFITDVGITGLNNLINRIKNGNDFYSSYKYTEQKIYK